MKHFTELMWTATTVVFVLAVVVFLLTWGL